ncbi:MAG: phosphopantetheine-binding protein [Bacteroidota bacterium]
MKTDQELYAQLRDIVKVYLPDDVAEGDITMQSNFTQELNINSANLVDIVLDVEDAFDIMLENDDMDGMETVSDAIAIVKRKVAQKEA